MAYRSNLRVAVIIVFSVFNIKLASITGSSILHTPPGYQHPLPRQSLRVIDTLVAVYYLAVLIRIKLPTFCQRLQHCIYYREDSDNNIKPWIHPFLELTESTVIVRFD